MTELGQFLTRYIVSLLRIVNRAYLRLGKTSDEKLTRRSNIVLAICIFCSPCTSVPLHYNYIANISYIIIV